MNLQMVGIVVAGLERIGIKLDAMSVIKLAPYLGRDLRTMGASDLAAVASALKIDGAANMFMARDYLVAKGFTSLDAIGESDRYEEFLSDLKFLAVGRVGVSTKCPVCSEPQEVGGSFVSETEHECSHCLSSFVVPPLEKHIAIEG